MTGSCFAENIGNKLHRLKYNISLNPFGIVYHPLPAAKNMERIISGKPYAEDELQLHQELWCSFDHHGRFSHPESRICIEQINTELQEARQRLSAANLLFVTFGTAWAYRRKADKRIVANCHKYPASEFERFRSDVDEIYEAWNATLTNLHPFNPNLRTVFTISPIRHLRDGAHENQLSKAVLLLAVDKLTRTSANIGYFPAYEIMLDDLRDYRFYDEDMAHPGTQAVNYIWQRFQECYMTKETQQLMKEVEEIVKAAAHRPIHRTSAYAAFAEKSLEKIAQLQQRLPQADFTKEIATFVKFQV
jgi:hypothetical protein